MHQLDEATIYQRRWLALAILSLSLVIIGLDNTVLNVALPHLSEDLSATNSQMQWIVDGYTMIFAGLILTTGSLGDRFGRKGALSLGLIVFIAGSVAAALAHSANELIFFRMAMGIGAAMIMPATLSLLTNIFHDPKERARAIGVWAGVAAAGIALGPIIGGLLLAHFWWGSVFLINLPVAAIALVAGHYVLPRSKDPSTPRTDPVGALLSVVALVTLLWGLIEAPTRGWASAPILAAFVAGLFLVGVFVVWEARSDHPMLEISFFKSRRFSAANAGITLVFFALMGSSFLITQQLQFVMGYSALKAGLAMTPIAVPMLILGPLSARIVERLGTKIVVSAGLLLAAIGLAWFSQVSLGAGYMSILLPMLVLASGMGLTMAPATESIMGSIPRAKAGVGSAMNDTTRQMGGALGVAVIGSVLASVYRPHVMANLQSTVLGQAAAGTGPTAIKAQQAVDLVHQQIGAAYVVADKLPGGLHGPLGSSVVNAARSAFVDGFGGAVLVGAIVAFIGAIVVFIFLPAHGVDPDATVKESEPSDSSEAEVDMAANGVAGPIGPNETADPAIANGVAAPPVRPLDPPLAPVDAP